MLPVVVLNIGEAIEEKEKEVKEESLDNSRSGLLSEFMVGKSLTHHIITPGLSLRETFIITNLLKLNLIWEHNNVDYH